MSLVDLPWRDPGLLTIAFAGLSLVAERRVLERGARWAAATGVALCLVLLPESFLHWRADRAFGRPYLRDRDRAALDDALRFERRHPEALIERSRPEDLDLLIEQQPHHAGAWYNRSLALPDDEAAALLRESLREHDPHHTLTFVRLARLALQNGERADAVILLNESIAADPRPVEPYVLMARALREGGMIERAEFWIDKIRGADYTPSVLRELLEIELATVCAPAAGTPSASNTSSRTCPPRRSRSASKRRCSAANGSSPRARCPVYSASRAKARRATSNASRRPRRSGAGCATPATEPEFREAFLLAEPLCRTSPTAYRLRQKARAARGLHDVERAGHFESQALYLEVIVALTERDPVTARRKLEKALLAYPRLFEEPEVLYATRMFARQHPEAVPLAREVFEGQAAALRAIR